MCLFSFITIFELWVKLLFWIYFMKSKRSPAPHKGFFRTFYVISLYCCCVCKWLLLSSYWCLLFFFLSIIEMYIPFLPIAPNSGYDLWLCNPNIRATWIVNVKYVRKKQKEEKKKKKKNWKKFVLSSFIVNGIMF